MLECSIEVKNYFNLLEYDFKKAFDAAAQARKRGVDPSAGVEILPAPDVASRVEGLVGPKGVAEKIRALSKGRGREETCIELAKQIMYGEFDGLGIEDVNQEIVLKRIEQAVRTGLALFTEGVVSAPIEGVTRVRLKKNVDGTEYLAVYFSGPIRGAGGTAQAFTLLLADYCRQIARITEFRPTEDEVARYVEEINLYAIRTRAGQYVPTEEEITHVAGNCPIAIDGEPTEDYEVGVHKNIPSVETNRVRSGVCLVVSEGICLKAAKVLKIAKKIGLDWNWLEKLIKVAKQEQEREALKPSEKYMDELVAGRPIFSYPMKPGGFGLKYGRSRFCGIAGKAIHPATMVLLQEFPAIGTQIKLERPGKACIVTGCETISGPVVKLRSGEVKQIETAVEAEAVKEEVEEILYLGNILVSYGDFLKSMHPLAQCCYCNEWFQQELKSVGVDKSVKELNALSAEEAFALAKEKAVPLAPKYVFNWHDLSVEQLKELAKYLAQGKLVFEWFEFKELRLPIAFEKRILEVLCIPHKVEGDAVVLDKNNAIAVLKTLALYDEENKKIDSAKFSEIISSLKEGEEVMEAVNKLAGVKIRKKIGLYIGASMGRPEKSRERKMQPPVHALFPISTLGGINRSLVKAFKHLKEKPAGEQKIELEVANNACPVCGRKTFKQKCDSCGEKTELVKQCMKCGKTVQREKESCSCGGKTRAFGPQMVDFVKAFEEATKQANYFPEDVKGVMGLISANKVPESLEKGILRAKHDVFVFRDGTIRFDATEIPITHFKPKEINVSVEKLRELGYDKDVLGRDLENEEQIVEMRAQDLIVSDNAMDYLLRVANFVDDELVYLYKVPPFYNAKTRTDLVGKLVIGIAPHTSAGVVGRIIGFTKVRGLLAHPYFHCACRRNCDGDELCVMLLMDGLLNFSRSFLPETRGGWMDAPLVLTILLDPKEVDDEVHAMDVCWSYSIDFYETAEKGAPPTSVKVDTVSQRLGTEKQFEGFGYTQETDLCGPVESRYVQLKSMPQKVKEELDLMQKIRAVEASNAAERIVLGHFFPDLYGNLRSFSKQKFRCVECNTKYRRIPLRGKCTKCGGKLLLTISKGSVEKYLKISLDLVQKYNLPNYLRQRLMLLEKEIESVFTDEKSKQFSLAEYV
jgi:DNA polymerase II large subunit